MSEQIIAILRRKLDDLSAHGQMDAENLRNALKEELQFYVLNFIYHHPEHNKWVMCGGSALRIIHGLDRMSVELDFEVSEKITKTFLEKLKKEIERHFSQHYNAPPDFLTVGIEAKRGLKLKFNVGEQLSLGHSSKWVHVKIDLNHFFASHLVTERRPINRGQLSFVILTYNMSTLMASKVAAIFLRGTRGVGKAVYEEKGRDIYDLLWYMNPDRKIIPDLDYLSAKNVKEAKDLRTLFDKLTVKMNAVSNANLKGDLFPLFLNRPFIENWIANWRESYFRLIEAYKICAVTTLEDVHVHHSHANDNFSFVYTYKTEEEKTFWIRYDMVEYWVVDCERGFPPTEINELISRNIQFTSDGRGIRSSYQEKLKQYATLFYQKNENYLNKANRIMLDSKLSTKLIRSTAEHLNNNKQIVLNKSVLLSCELEDLLK